MSSGAGGEAGHGGGVQGVSLCPCRCPGRFKATLWLCEQHPLSLAEQVTPIIDLMAISNAHFAKLRDFITLKLPPGFPVKIGEVGAARLGAAGGAVPARHGAADPLWCPPRDSPLPRPQRPHHLQQPVWLRPAAGLRAGLRPPPAPRRAAPRPWR